MLLRFDISCQNHPGRYKLCLPYNHSKDGLTLKNLYFYGWQLLPNIKMHWRTLKFWCNNNTRLVFCCDSIFVVKYNEIMFLCMLSGHISACVWWLVNIVGPHYRTFSLVHSQNTYGGKYCCRRMYGNNFSGPIPPSILTLTSIQTLWVFVLKSWLIRFLPAIDV